jgi:hypothetical protein
MSADMLAKNDMVLEVDVRLDNDGVVRRPAAPSSWVALPARRGVMTSVRPPAMPMSVRPSTCRRRASRIHRGALTAASAG